MKRNLIPLTFLLLVLSITGCSAIRFAENRAGYGIKRTPAGEPETRRAQLSRQDLQLGITSTDSGLSLRLQLLPYYHLEQRQTFTSRARLTGVDIAVGLASAGILGWVAYDSWSGDGTYIIGADGNLQERRSFNWGKAAPWQKAVMIGIPADFVLSAILHTLPQKVTTPWEQSGEESGTIEWLKNHPYRIEIPGYNLQKDYRTKSGRETIAIRDLLVDVKNPASFLEVDTLEILASTEFQGKPYTETLTLTDAVRLKPFLDFARAAVPDSKTVTSRTARQTQRAETTADTARKEVPPLDPTPPTIAVDPISTVNARTQRITIRGSVTSRNSIQGNRIRVSSGGRTLPSATVSAKGRFALTIPLSEGDNRIGLVAVDENNKQGKASFTIHRPATLPQIDILEPSLANNTATIAPSSFRVMVRVTDESGVAEVKINGLQATAIGNDRFSRQVSYTSNLKRVEVSATDTKGYTETESFQVIAQAKPQPPVAARTHTPQATDLSRRTARERVDPRLLFADSQLEQNRHQTINTEAFTLEFVVIDDSRINAVTVTRRSDGTNYQVSKHGKRDYEARLHLNAGENRFEIRVEDEWENVELETVTIIRVAADTKAPTLISLSVGESDWVQQISVRGGYLNDREPILVTNETTAIRGMLSDDSGIASVSLAVNEETAEAVVIQEGTRFEKKISLSYGRNRVTIKAADTRGNADQNEFIIRHRPNRDGQDFALLFGTDEYTKFGPDNYGWDNLKTAIKDAEGVARKLRNNYGFRTKIIKNSTRRQLMETLLAYKNSFTDEHGTEFSYQPGSQLLLYFAGHGYYHEQTETGYLIARDSEPPKLDPSQDTAIEHERLRKQIDLIECDRILVMMDTCFSGTFDPKYQPRISPQVRSIIDDGTLLEQINNMLKLPARWCLTAASNEYVADGSGHSPFAAAFLEVLDAKGGQDSLLKLDEIWGKIYESRNADIYKSYIKAFEEQGKEFKLPEPRKGQFGAKSELYEESDFLLFPLMTD